MDDTSRHRLLLTVLVTGGLMVVLDVTITNVAVRTLAEELDAPLPVVQWVSTAYTLALATVVPTTAWLVGRLGTRRVYLCAVTLFTVGSVLCAAAWDVGSLIAFRALQGAGGAVVTPVAMMIALRSAPEERRGRAMGTLGLPVLVGPVVGPVLGGWLVELSWRWIFLVNLPVGLLAVALGLRLLPRDRPGGAGDRLDLGGLALIAPGLALTVYGLAEIGRGGHVTSWEVLLPALAGVGLCAAFGRRAARIPAPLVRVRLLRTRALASGAGTVALFAAAYFGSMFVLPLYWQLARGLSPAQAGAMGIPQALATGISLQVASRLVDRVAPARVVGVGIALAASGLVAVAALLSADTPYWQVMAAATVTGIGVGASVMPAMTTALRHLPEADVPSGSTLLNITNQASVSVGTALTSVVLTYGLTSRAVVATGGELPTVVSGAAAHQIAQACQHTLFVPVGLMVAALVVSLSTLPRGSAGASQTSSADQTSSVSQTGLSQTGLSQDGSSQDGSSQDGVAVTKSMSRSTAPSRPTSRSE